jgi:hypothetical protein
MLRIRIVSAAIILTAATLFAGNLAAAPTTTDQNGKPLALLAGLKPPPEHKFAHAKVAHTNTAELANKHPAKHTKLAHNKHHTVVAAKTEAPIEPIKSEQQADTAPVALATAPADGTPPANTAVNNPPADNGLGPNGLGMNAIVVGGQTVQIAAPDAVNALDLAADDHAAKVDATADTPTSSPSTLLADAAPVRNVYAAPISKASAQSSAIGSMSWIAQVLAAFGGAVTAGVVAWFLIGGGPARMYG